MAYTGHIIQFESQTCKSWKLLKHDKISPPGMVGGLSCAERSLPACWRRRTSAAVLHWCCRSGLKHTSSSRPLKQWNVSMMRTVKDLRGYPPGTCYSRIWWWGCTTSRWLVPAAWSHNRSKTPKPGSTSPPLDAHPHAATWEAKETVSMTSWTKNGKLKTHLSDRHKQAAASNEGW